MSRPTNMSKPSIMTREEYNLRGQHYPEKYRSHYQRYVSIEWSIFLKIKFNRFHTATIKNTRLNQEQQTALTNLAARGNDFIEYLECIRTKVGFTKGISLLENLNETLDLIMISNDDVGLETKELSLKNLKQKADEVSKILAPSERKKFWGKVTALIGLIACAMSFAMSPLTSIVVAKLGLFTATYMAGLALGSYYRDEQASKATKNLGDALNIPTQTAGKTAETIDEFKPRMLLVPSAPSM